MEDNVSRRVEILEEKMKMALQQLREHDQAIQVIPGIPKSEEWWNEQLRIGEERRIAREVVQKAKEVEQSGEPAKEGPQPAKRLYHQEVLDELMRIVRDETGQLIAEHNVVQVLTDLLKKLRSIESQHKVVQDFLKSQIEQHK